MDFQFRATEDGKIHCWRRGNSPPPEARWDICPNGCRTNGGNPQRLIAEKTEFPGKEGKISRTYKCPQCAYVGRIIRRKRNKTSKWDLKEPE
jgi:hypothetical protein